MFTHLISPDRPTWTWERLGEVCAQTALPWMAKGILHPDDARFAVDAGASAVLVSNHGGRRLDGAGAGGQVGVERMHELLLAELRTIMMLCGCARTAELRGRIRPERP